MVYLCIISIIISTFSLIYVCKDNENAGFVCLIISIICIIIIYNRFNEPQIIKEKCVKLGIGKFVADDKANVKFYFINHKNEMIEYNQLIEYDRNQENK